MKTTELIHMSTYWVFSPDLPRHTCSNILQFFGSHMTYEFKTQPWEHQREAIRRAWKREGFAYLMEMGTGKSKVAIDEACVYFESAMITGMVVMAPKGVYMNWVREGGELDTHMPDRVRSRAVIATWMPGGGNKQNQKMLELALRGGPGIRILVMNTEAVSTAGPARVYLEKFLQAHTCIWDLDEATFIKNPTAARTKYIVKTAPLAAYRRVMTGSPVTKSPLDLYSMFEFLHSGMLGHRSFYSFRARYAVLRDQNFGGRRVQVVVGYRNLSELTVRLQDHSFRVTKEECLDLPPKVYTRRDVELTPEQEQLYVQIREEAFSMLGDDGAFISTSAVITQLLRLQQVLCGHVPDDDGEMHQIPSRRVESLMEVLDEAQGKVIIWARFREDIRRIVEAISKEYGEGSVAQYHGGNVNTRQEDAARFISDPACRFMVSNQQAGGYGNTWIVATTVVYYSNDFDLEKRLQSEDRAHRGGQTEKVTYVDLIARGTIDEHIVKALRSKINIAQTITGDAAREWLV